jgi:nitrite reductase (NADH) small subunit
MSAVAREMEWLEVGALEDIPVLGARVVRTLDGDIAVFRNRDGEVFALLDRCPHKGGPLSQGIVHGRSVTCPLHGWCIGLANGRALPPDEGSTPTHEVRVENGRIYLRIGG